MRSIREWIQEESEVLGSEYLRVDGILNHCVHPEFIVCVGEELWRCFNGLDITCVVTAEAAGNIVAYELARRLGVRALYAKKGKAATMIRLLVRTVVSPTKGVPVELALSRDYLSPDDCVIVVDDFLYQGKTSAVLADMVLESGATLVGFSFAIEKTFARGRDALARFEVPVETLAPIRAMDPQSGTIEFAEMVA